MSEAVDVGSVLGGRYRVTAHVLTSAQQDLVLDGVDQVLNRPVSILVASEPNAEQALVSARELATGDRNEKIQVLDLLTTDIGTALITNRTPAAGMLDLILDQDAPMDDTPAEDGPYGDAEDEPYVEPFFTDTLGSEIFGRPRSTEPEASDDEDYEEVRPQSRWSSGFSALRRRFDRQAQEQGDDSAEIGPVEAAPAADSRPTSHLVPPPPSSRPSSYRGGDEAQDQEEPQVREAVAAGAVGATAAGATDREASRFPFFDPRDEEGEDESYPDDEDPADGGRPFTRVLLGVLLSIVLVIAVVLVATQLGSLFGGEPTAEEQPDQGTSAPATPVPTAAPTTAAADPEPEPVQPVITGIARVVPDNPGLDAGNDVNLPRIIDGDPATFWGNQVYASDTFGGLASNLALVVELEEESAVSQVTIDQLNGSGGAFTVLVNDEPTIEGAEEVAQGSFTSPSISLPVPEGDDGPPTGSYVIIDVTRLPLLSNIQAQYPFGLRIAEIAVE
ncbi:hypothetical protein E8P82_02015 [Arthrobacter echini]|uniref:Uncharacterized protein n=1 Tax=Arthrobacter echini TaxID=1529066 RepID=A0A4V3Z658_9MICC|nr:hypothetical protein [Arthrobacter echini]THJ68699.1 hypothetical protein E8P82_02015 [Arthrobacter echini]